MEMISFENYFKEYKEFYEGVFELAKMQNKISGREITFEELKKYNKLEKELLSQCPEGTDIQDLIGLVVVGESKREGGFEKL